MGDQSALAYIPQKGGKGAGKKYVEVDEKDKLKYEHCGHLWHTEEICSDLHGWLAKLLVQILQ